MIDLPFVRRAAFFVFLAGCGDAASTDPDGSMPLDAGEDAAEDAADGAVAPDFAQIVPVLTTRPGEGKIHLSFTEVPGASSYNIYRDTQPGQPGTLLASSTSLTYDDATAPLFEIEHYKVRAVVGGSEGAPSNEARGIAYDLKSFTVRQSAVTLRDLAYAPASAIGGSADVYLAIGDYGRMLRSADGVTFVDAQAGDAKHWRALAFDGTFVGVGDPQGSGNGEIFTSSDGVHFDLHDTGLSSTPLMDVAIARYGLGGTTRRYIAVGGSGKILSSPDASTWTPLSCGSDPLVTISVLQHVTLQKVGMLMIPNYSYVAVAAGLDTVCYSTDGITWNAQAGVPAGGYVGSTVDAANDTVAIITDAGKVLRFTYDFMNATSSLGAGPTASTSDFIVGFTSYLSGANRHFVAMDGSGATFDSVDGAAFTALNPPAIAGLRDTPVYATNLAEANGKLYLLGASEVIASSSNGGSSFSLQHDGRMGTYASTQFAHGRAVALGRNDTDGFPAQVSSDAQSFAPFPLPSGIPVGPLLATAGGFASFQSSSNALRIAESSNGETWTASDVPTPACLGCDFIAFGAVRTSTEFLASVSGHSPGNTVYFTVRGNPGAWTTSSQTLAFRSLWQAGGKYHGLVAVPGSIQESSDGASWTLETSLPADGAFAYFDDGGTRWVGFFDGSVSSSVDGTTWTVPVDTHLASVQQILRFGDHLVAVGAKGGLAVSTDGQAWMPLYPPLWTDFVTATATDVSLIVGGGIGTLLTLP